MNKIYQYTDIIYDSSKNVYYIGELRVFLYIPKNSNDYVEEETLKLKYKKSYFTSIANTYKSYLSSLEKVVVNLDVFNNIYNSYTENEN